MEKVWSIETYGDPQGALSQFLVYVWREARLDGMIVSSDALTDGEARLRVLEQPEQIRSVNLFWPAMRDNLARDIPEALRDRPNARLGAIVRPCESRALDSIAQIVPFPQERLLTISVDCLGTFPAAEIEWRAGRKGEENGLSQDALRFARVGGIAFYRYRPACQVCRSPAAQAADINVGVIGLPTRQFLLVMPRQAETARRLRFEAFPLGKARPDLTRKRERVLNQMVARNHLARERFVHSLVASVPDTLDAFVEQLERCGDCQECLRVCPICSVQPVQRHADRRYDREAIARWLAACAGCGMCEQACSKNLPLSAMFSVIREHLQANVIIPQDKNAP